MSWHPTHDVVHLECELCGTRSHWAGAADPCPRRGMVGEDSLVARRKRAKKNRAKRAATLEETLAKHAERVGA